MPEVDVFESGHYADNVFIIVVEGVHLGSAIVDLLCCFVAEKALSPFADLVPIVKAENRVDDDFFVFVPQLAALLDSIIHIKPGVDLTIHKSHAIDLHGWEKGWHCGGGQQGLSEGISRSILVIRHDRASVQVD